MININIFEAASYTNISALKAVMHDNWILKEVRIDYNTLTGIPLENMPEKFPFKAIFYSGDLKIEVRICSLTAGYPGTGPHDLAKILDFLGIQYDKEDIFTKKKRGEDGFIRLTYKC